MTKMMFFNLDALTSDASRQLAIRFLIESGQPEVKVDQNKQPFVVYVCQHAFFYTQKKLKEIDWLGKQFEVLVIQGNMTFAEYVLDWLKKIDIVKMAFEKRISQLPERERNLMPIISKQGQFQAPYPLAMTNDDFSILKAINVEVIPVQTTQEIL